MPMCTGRCCVRSCLCAARTGAARACVFESVLRVKMLARHVISVAVIVSVGGSASRAKSGDVQVFVHGEGGYPCIRTPSMVYTSTGTLLAFAGTRCGQGDGCSPTSPFNQSFTHQDAVMKRSIDGGATWGPLTVVHIAACSQHDHGAPGSQRCPPHSRVWLAVRDQL